MLAKELFTALRMFLVLTIIFGLIYPSVVTLCAQGFFHHEANGSLVVVNNEIIGSRLLGQEFKQDHYFHSRPSATSYATVPSGASNLSITNKVFRDHFLTLMATLGPNTPADLLTSSGSGLDPHISPRAAFFQLLRIAQSRGLGPDGLSRLQHLVMSQVELPTLGFLGNPRVNVLKLNLILDREFPHE